MSQEVIDIDSDGSEDEGDSEFQTFDQDLPRYEKPKKSLFFARLNNTIKDDEDTADKVWVQNIDWMVKENKAEHCTDLYDNKRLILRRGKEFNMKLKFDKDFDVKKHSVIFTFYTGDRPSISKYIYIYKFTSSNPN